MYPARELGIFAIFHNFFLHGSHTYIFLFDTSIASVGTDERIAKICVSKCPKLKFLWDFEKGWNGPKVNVERVDFWLEMGLYQNFSTLAQLKSVQKSGELLREEKWRRRRNTSYIDFWSILAYFKVP